MSYAARFCGWLLDLWDARSRYVYACLIFAGFLASLVCIVVCAGIASLMLLATICAGLSAAQAGWSQESVIWLGLCAVATAFYCRLAARICRQPVRLMRWRVFRAWGVFSDWRWTVTEEARANWYGRIFDHQIGIVIEILIDAIRDLAAPNMEFSFAGLLTQMSKISRGLKPDDERVIDVVVKYLSHFVDDPAGELFIHAIAHGILSVDLLEGIMAHKQQKVWDQIVEANRIHRDGVTQG